jgi:hypothetical protein
VLDWECPANDFPFYSLEVRAAHDLVFQSAARMNALFDELARQALLTVKTEDVARFLGKRLPMSHDTQVNSHLGRRYEGLRLKHSFGPASVKLYNKPGGILRLEMTTYDVSFFRHYRQVVHQDGTKEQQLAAMKKSISSLADSAALMRAGVQRYSPWLASLEEHTAGHQDISLKTAVGTTKYTKHTKTERVPAESEFTELVTIGAAASPPFSCVSCISW